MARKPNTKRNQELVLKRVSDPKEWSFRALSRHYKIDVRAAYEIFNRDIRKYASPAQVSGYRKALRLSTSHALRR